MMATIAYQHPFIPGIPTPVFDALAILHVKHVTDFSACNLILEELLQDGLFFVAQQIVGQKAFQTPSYGPELAIAP
jgi:hypothetical protein